MALVSVELEAISAGELRRRLVASGYDVGQVDKLGQTLGVDLLPILAGWAPVLVDMMRPWQPRRRRWWQWWQWIRRT